MLERERENVTITKKRLKESKTNRSNTHGHKNLKLFLEQNSSYFIGVVVLVCFEHVYACVSEFGKS